MTKDNALRLDCKFMTGLIDLKFDAAEGRITGYASRFGEVDRGGDMIMPGAYAKSLVERGATQVKMLWQHDPAQPIGKWDEVAEDDVGLKVSGHLLAGIRKADEAAILIKAGVLDGLSIGYRTIRREFVTENDRTYRKLLELDLWEVSAVTFPMQTTARINKSVDFTSPRDVEEYLREGGASHAAAKAIAVSGVRSVPRDEAGTGTSSVDAFAQYLTNAISG